MLSESINVTLMSMTDEKLQHLKVTSVQTNSVYPPAAGSAGVNPVDELLLVVKIQTNDVVKTLE